ncbi:uncharacterized protein LOC135836491 [Planococcus citri]|uniref:uncharacterized protein LOC135836491 n=1 Tax=Planococcus citri TaxID=170843 RepID=UPI0031F73922
MSDISTSSNSTNLDIGFLLPSDDQLDDLVDKLCDNMPTLSIASETNDSRKNSSVTSSTGSDTGDNSDELKIDPNEESSLSAESNSPVDNLNHVVKSTKHFDKRSLFNNDLNIAIMQCSGSLEVLSERRKVLEMLAQQHHNMPTNCNNFAYAPRLPDSPTRVDRLMYDISRERCRILVLISNLDKTIQSFSSKTTKDDLRKLLIAFGASILDVMKERQSEVIFNQSNGTIGDYDSSKGVLNLVELLGQVHRMNRAVHTALWCIEKKEQASVVLQRNINRTGAANSTAQPAQRSSNQLGIPVQNSWQCLKPTSIPPKRHNPPFNRTSLGVASKSAQQPALLVSQPQTSVYQMLASSQSKPQKGVQVYGQEQKKGDLYQHFYPLRQSS